MYLTVQRKVIAKMTEAKSPILCFPPRKLSGRNGSMPFDGKKGNTSQLNPRQKSVPGILGSMNSRNPWPGRCLCDQTLFLRGFRGLALRHESVKRQHHGNWKAEEKVDEENIMGVSDDDSTSDTSEETQGGEGDLTHKHVLKTPPRKTLQKDHDLAESQER